MSGERADEAVVAYDNFEPDEEGLREALTSTGNGYFCTRGAAEWEDAGGAHYPGTYAHGGYNRETTVMGGRPVLNEDLVNLPNWLVLKLRIEGDDAIGLDNVELLEYRHEYDIRYALLSRTVRFRDRAGRETSLRSRRFVSMAHHHQAAIEWVITPENWSGRIEVISAIDGRVTNRGVARYAELEGRHLDPVSPRTFGPEVIALKVQTRKSNLYFAQAARTNVFRGDEPVDVQRSLFQTEDYIQQVVACDARAGEPVRVEKMVAFYTSRDRAISETLGSAGESASRYPGFAEALERHKRAWDELWRACDMQAAGKRSRPTPAAPPHLPRPAGVLPLHGRPGRRSAGARSQRRGLPRARLLGRALRLSVPELPPSRHHPRPAHVPLPASRPGPVRRA